MRKTAIKRRPKSKRKSAKLARKRIKTLFAKKKRKVIKKKEKRVPWNKRKWKENPKWDKYFESLDKYDRHGDFGGGAHTPTSDPFFDPPPIRGEFRLDSGKGTPMDIDDDEDEDEKQMESPLKIGILSDGVDIEYYPTHRHQSGLQNDSTMDADATDKYNTKRRMTKRSKQKTKDHPNVGLLVTQFVYKDKVFRKYGTATVVGASKRTLITVAHNLIGHDFDKGAVANKVTFYRGANQFGLPRLKEGKLITELTLAGSRYLTSPDVISAEHWSIFPGYMSQSELHYDVALIRLKRPCVKAEIARLVDTSVRLPKYCRLDGYPMMSLKETFPERQLYQEVMVATEDPRFRNRVIGHRSQKMYGSVGEVINCKLDGDFDYIGHTCYASAGQSGAALMVTDKKGVYSNGIQAIFALHSAGTNWDVGYRVKLTAVLLHKGMLDWILHETKRWNINESIQVLSIKSGYNDCFVGKNNPELDGYFKSLKKFDVYGDF